MRDALIGKRQRRQRLRFDIDANDCQVTRTIGGLNRQDRQHTSVWKFQLEWSPLADHMQIGGDQPAGIDHKAGAHGQFVTVTSVDTNRDDRRTDLLDQLSDRQLSEGLLRHRRFHDRRFHDRRFHHRRGLRLVIRLLCSNRGSPEGKDQ